MDRTTASFTLKHDVAKAFNDTLTNALQNNVFSLNIDEATSKTSKHLLSILASYYSPDDSQVVDKHLHSCSVACINSETIQKVLVNVLEEKTPSGHLCQHLDQTPLTSEISSDPNAGQQLVSWGMDVVVGTCKEKFQRFVMKFIDPNANPKEWFCGYGEDDFTVINPNVLPFQINTIGEPFLNFSATHLKQFDANLYRQLICYPQEVIPTFDMAINEMFFFLKSIPIQCWSIRNRLDLMMWRRRQT
ncbi:hypothetical protein LSH36_1198g00017 [Paralvinella palmiformis]|uniref:MCM N-terminal domain-containing protein n=1 Tax=Paralvinella palmiformis TaxID=53620 RepID=A0AAD9IUS2_9ANNE|nr:hypothetical protein LSH36_1198g00017 [Paralvinella palmiformis]